MTIKLFKKSLMSDVFSRNMKNPFTEGKTFKKYECTSCQAKADWPYDPSEKQIKCVNCGNDLWDEIK